MRVTVRLVAMSIAFACVSDATGGQTPPSADISGEVRYLKDGVELAGRFVAWKDLRSLEDVAPSPEALSAELARRRKERPKEVAAYLRLGAWARDNGLDDEAKSEFDEAVALGPENADARRAAGFVRVGNEWRRTADVLAEKLASPGADAKASRLGLAKWCGENGDPEDEWRLLGALAVADPYDKAMIARVKALVAPRRQHSTFVPPLDGTWRAVLDTTKHHQAKVFAIEAIDFRKVDAGGTFFKGKGLSLEDFHAWGSVIRACGDGVVSDSDDHYPDMPPGVAGRYEEANYVSIRHDGGETTDYGHIRHGSALVRSGDVVKAGQPIALVGNSGASGVPHLHFSLVVTAKDEAGGDERIAVPWRLSGFRVIEAGGAACDFEAKTARVLEGWTVRFPDRE